MIVLVLDPTREDEQQTTINHRWPSPFPIRMNRKHSSMLCSSPPLSTISSEGVIVPTTFLSKHWFDQEDCAKSSHIRQIFSDERPQLPRRINLHSEGDWHTITVDDEESSITFLWKRIYMHSETDRQADRRRINNRKKNIKPRKAEWHRELALRRFSGYHRSRRDGCGGYVLERQWIRKTDSLPSWDIFSRVRDMRRGILDLNGRSDTDRQWIIHRRYEWMQKRWNLLFFRFYRGYDDWQERCDNEPIIRMALFSN